MSATVLDICMSLDGLSPGQCGRPNQQVSAAGGRSRLPLSPTHEQRRRAAGLEDRRKRSSAPGPRISLALAAANWSLERKCTSERPQLDALAGERGPHCGVAECLYLVEALNAVRRREGGVEPGMATELCDAAR